MGNRSEGDSGDIDVALPAFTVELSIKARESDATATHLWAAIDRILAAACARSPHMKFDWDTVTVRVEEIEPVKTP